MDRTDKINFSRRTDQITSNRRTVLAFCQLYLAQLFGISGPQ